MEDHILVRAGLHLLFDGFVLCLVHCAEFYILASLQVALSGFLAAIIIGVPLGLVMGWWTYADRFIRPIFELVRPVPPIAWIPLVVVWMGIGLKAKALIIFF